jgi:TPR repeat protein
MNGRGVEKDIDEAFYWFNKAAKQGHESAIDIVKELSKRYL